MTTPESKTAVPSSADVLRRELANGIVVLVRENFTSPSVVIDGVVAGGAAWDPPGKAGTANFAARMLTRGTTNYSFGDLFEEIEENGASLEVSSGYSSMTFGTKSLAEDLPRMLKLLREVLCEPTFPEDYVEKVRGQLLTQLQARANNTRSMAALRMRETLYEEGHPYRLSRAGYLESVPGIMRDDLVELHRLIGPQDMIVVVAGAVEAEKAVQAIEEAFGDWQNPAQRERPSIPDAPAPQTIERVTEAIPGKTQSDIALGFIGPRRSAPDYQAARVANSILGVFGMYGRLGDSVRERQGLAYYSFSRMRGGLGPLPWQVIAGVAPENVERAIDSIREEIRRIVEEPVDTDELTDNQSFIVGSLVLGLETNEGVSGTLLNMELYDLGLDYLVAYPDMINSVTIEDVQAAARAYLNPDAYVAAVAGPET
ncbi:MAG: insulinase family protein [Chloroflexi bacterium]|nr:insulinase family protein [Chloroflexota bacterium]